MDCSLCLKETLFNFNGVFSVSPAEILAIPFGALLSIVDLARM